MDEIQVDSLDAVRARYDFGDDPDQYPPGRLDEWDALHEGRVLVALPDGKRYWLPTRPETAEANLHGAAGDALLSAVLDHNAVHTHAPCDVFVEYGRSVIGEAFCAECRRFVDLAADVAEMDTMLGA